MIELSTYRQHLPATVDDLAKFLLIAPEKATALRAEIRAIEKAGFAKEVYDQKLEEQRRLCDMILDASVRLGELTKEIPKNSGARTDLQPNDSAVARSDEQKPKSQVVQELGFSPKQVERFEALANNRDLVETEKATAREEGRMPTRTNVIDMAKARKDKFERDIEQIDADAKLNKLFIDAVFGPLKLSEDNTEIAKSLYRAHDGDIQSDIKYIDDAVAKLNAIKVQLIKEVTKNGKK